VYLCRSRGSSIMKKNNLWFMDLSVIYGLGFMASDIWWFMNDGL
jgi:hypothetical protein